MRLCYEDKMCLTIEGAHDIGKTVIMAAVALGRLQKEKLLPKLVYHYEQDTQDIQKQVT